MNESKKGIIKTRKIPLSQETYTRQEVARILNTEMEWQWMNVQIAFERIGHTLTDYKHREDV